MKLSRKIKPSCVYCILNIVTEERYVGSSYNFSSRKASHLYEMRHNKHLNHKLQEAYDVYGEASLKFFVLEEVETFDRDYLEQREQFWINKYLPEYNLNPVAGNYFNTSAFSSEAKEKRRKTLKGWKRSPEGNKKHSESMLKYYETHTKIISDEQKQKLSEANMGSRNPNWGKHRTEETKKKAHDSLSHIAYTFLSPDGEEKTIKGLMTEAETVLGIPYGSARNLYRGITKEHKGWKFLRSENI